MPPSRRNAEVRGFAAVWQRRGFLAWLLLPLSLLFMALVCGRRALYSAGLLPQQRLPVAVVVVGNLSVGGTGKTPLVIYLAQALRRLGRHPGIVSRGYRGDADQIIEVKPDSNPGVVGDEPLLLVRHGGCPVFVGRDRAAAGRAMLEAYPDCDLILADDGLQHYRLARDVELVMFDSRGVMNGWPLPAGPLREPVARLAQADAIILNGIAVSPAPTFSRPVFTMRLADAGFQRLDDPLIKCSAADLAGKTLHAVAGIGAPQRFFARLAQMGLDCVEHPFADHHGFCADDLEFAGDAILTTEKDAVKLTRLSLSLPVWVLPVTAEVSPDLAEFVLEKLNGPSPA